jgi:replication initiation and membrane attachment protein DnaB
MVEREVEKYIMRDLGFIPRHDCKALAAAITDMAEEIDTNERELMELLLNNKPINSLMTHSYGFHTRTGREIINKLKEKYYEYES